MTKNRKTSGNNSKKSKRVPKHTNADGSPNTHYVDLLRQDAPLAGQAWGCFSFLSPEKIIKQKELFYFEQFLKTWDMNKSMEKFHQFVNFLAFKYSLSPEDLLNDLNDFVKEEREFIGSFASVEADFKNFLDKNETQLQHKFDVKYREENPPEEGEEEYGAFETSVRGFKARGNFGTEEEARMRSKLLREADPDFDIFVGPVGTWLPWEPEAYKTGEVQYLEEELNQLAHEKLANEQSAKNAFEERIRESKQKAIEENKKNAAKHGNVITQDIDADGNLIDVRLEPNHAGGESKDNNFAVSNEVVDVDAIHAQLFEGDNIVIGKK